MNLGAPPLVTSTSADVWARRESYAEPVSHPPVVLVIAGSDSGGGAGIQADIKTVMARGAHALTVITAVTAQNSQGVQGVWPLPVDAVVAQFRSVMDDIGAEAIKIGMLGTAELVSCVQELLEPWHDRIPIVVDPVCASKHGDPLLIDDAIESLAKQIVPLASVLTPNIPEAELLLRALGHDTMTIADAHAQSHAAELLVAAGARWALVKGGHADGGQAHEVASDVLSDGVEQRWFSAPRANTVHTHGTGCTLASAVAAGLAHGMDVPQAVSEAKGYITGAIAMGYKLGAGIGPVDHAWQWR